MARLTEERILQAVIEEIDSAGIEAFSMRGLSRRLDVTATAIYYHFDNKEALLDEAASFTTKRLVAASDPERVWTDRLVDLLMSAADEALRYPNTFRWMLATYAKRPPMQVLDDAVLNLLAEGGLDPSAASHAKGALLRMLVGHVTLTHPEPTTEGSFDPGRVLRTGLDAIIASFSEA